MALLSSYKKPTITYPELTGAVVTFNCLDALPLKTCVFDIDYDANGVSGLTITANGSTQSVSFGSTIYGGSFDAKSGVLTSDKAADGSDITLVYTQLTAVNLETVIGVNSFEADTGDTTLQYIKIGG